MFHKYKAYLNSPFKLLVILVFIFSSLIYGCQNNKKSVLFWEEKYYYDINAAREAITNSADKRLETVTELSTPLFNSNLLIVVPFQEMAIWSKGEKHSNEAIRLILQAGLQMYASAIKKHNMFESVEIISSEDLTIDRTAFDFILYVDGLVPRTDNPTWVIKKSGDNIKMPYQLAIEDYFVEISLNEAVDMSKNTVIMIYEIISSMQEHKEIEKYMNEIQ